MLTVLKSWQCLANDITDKVYYTRNLLSLVKWYHGRPQILRLLTAINFTAKIIKLTNIYMATLIG